MTGNLSLDLRRLRLAGVVEAALETVALQADRKKIRVDVELDEATGFVSGDSLRLQQVVSNLITNAIKFTPEGGEVKVALASRGGEAILRINPAFLVAQGYSVRARHRAVTGRV